MTKQLSLVLMISLLWGCSRQASENSRIEIVMPSLGHSHQSLKSADFEWLNTGSLAAITDANCFLIAVGGPTAPLKRNSCPLKSSSSKIQFGPWAGGVASGQAAVLEVESGPARVIYVLAAQAKNGACTDFKINSQAITSDDLTDFRVIAQKKVDLKPGDQTVNISLPSSVASLPEVRPADCEIVDAVKDPSTTPPPGPTYDPIALWGSGEDGDLSLTDAAYTSDQVLLPDGSRPLQSFAGVSAISADRTLLTIGSQSTPTLSGGFTPGDRVLFIVDRAHDATGSSGPDGVCGGGLYRGFNRYATVSSVDDTQGKIQLDRPITNNTTAINNAAISAAVAEAGTSFCRIQIVRVPQLNTLTLEASAGFASLEAPLYNGEWGGVLALKVKTTLYAILGNNNVYISAAGRGFASGTPSSPAQGHDAPDLGSAGASVSASYAGGGGGGNATPGGDASDPTTPATVSGGTAMNFCMNGTICPPGAKLLMGGGGGSGSNNYGGKGGGIIAINARKIKISAAAASLNLVFKAYGAAGLEANTATQGGGGGGAGGNILIKAEGLEVDASSIVHTGIKMDASGGAGGGAESAPMTTGGGGGAGATELQLCQPFDTINSYLDVAATSSGGQSPTTTGGSSVTGVSAGDSPVTSPFGIGDFSFQNPALCPPAI